MSDWKVLALPPALRQPWLETRAAMQWTQPGLTSVLYSMMNQDGGDSVFWFTHDIDTMAIDGRRIWANPDYYFALPIGQRIFGGMHEVMHGVLRHCEVLHWHIKGNHPVIWKQHVMVFDIKRAMWAMDFVVNAILIAASVGEYNPNWLYDPAIATEKTTWQEAYWKLERAEAQGRPQPQPQGQPQPGQGQPGQGPPQPNRQGEAGEVPPHAGTLQGPQDYHAPPGTSQGKPADDPGVQASDMEWKVALKAAIAVGEKAGKMPAALMHAFGEVLETKTTWTDHLQGILARGLGGGGYNYRKADRRFVMRRIYTPARSGKGCNTVVIAGDSSGSIYRVPKQIDRIFAETKQVLEQVRPKRIVLLWCDSKIQRVDEIADAHDLEVTHREGAKGGGGTKFRPVFKWIDDNLDQVDALLYFTDGENDYGEKLDEPDYPVIWGHIGKPDHKYPFGEMVVIPKEA